MAKNWLKELQTLNGALRDEVDPHDRVLRFPSPSINFVFGRGHGLPLGYTMALGGPPKGGKTVMSFALAGQVHADDPEGIVVNFNTEYRATVQSTLEARQRVWGIDPERYQTFEVNSPMDVFDTIERDISAMCEKGMPLRLLIIDSIDGIQGRRAKNSDTVETQQIGDWAQTLSDGFKRVLPVQRKHKFAVLLICQIRAEMDRLEQMRGNKYKMKLPLAVQHYAEYFMYAEPDLTKEGRADLLGNEFRDENLTDMSNKADHTGIKIKVKMKDNSCGPKGRTGQFTLDFNRGIINIHEEVFMLGVNRHVIEKPNNLTYTYASEKWVGKPAALSAIKASIPLQIQILNEVQNRDRSGCYEKQDALDEEGLDADE